MATHPPAFTHDQITQYFRRIRLPEKQWVFDVAQHPSQDALSYLTLLQQSHLLQVPFENLSLHYSSPRRVSIDPDELYQKIVMDPGRGGYCMELNAVFGRLLRSVGFDVYATGARVDEGTGYGGWSHMLNIVTINREKFMVDVGFGSNYVAIKPMSLRKTSAPVFHFNVHPASCRLVRKTLDGALSGDSQLWVYQHRVGGDSKVKDWLCFSELEFQHADFEVMNWYTSTSPKIWFTQQVVCTKMISSADEGSKIAGVLDISDRGVKSRIGADTEWETEFEKDEDRVVALRKWFDIKLTAEQAESIKDTVGEIKG